MASRGKWDGNIESLPTEILTHSIRAIPRADLRDVGNRLSARADGDFVESWERVAARLGLSEGDVDHVQAQAREQDSSPGYLVLQEWGHRPGSTAYVLLHALREIQREDVVHVLVERLMDLNSVLLLISVEDREGGSQFRRVRTRKDAPLHASLDNELPADLYWYDIVGPWSGLQWDTPSGHLQGALLTLKLREEPCLQSKSLIYGIKPSGCQAPASGGTPGRSQNPRGSPIPSVSVTVDLRDSDRLDVKAEVPNIRLVNDLSSNRLSPVPKTDHFIDNLRTGLGSPIGSNDLPPPVPGRVQVPCRSQAEDRLPTPEETTGGCPSLRPGDLPLLSAFSSFSSFSTSPRSDTCELPGPSLPPNILPVNSVDISHTFVKECRVTSLTEAKQIASGGCRPPVPHRRMKDSAAKGEGDGERTGHSVVFENADRSPGERDEQDLRGSERGSSSSSTVTVSCLHPDYVYPEGGKLSDVRYGGREGHASSRVGNSQTQQTAQSERGKDVPASGGQSPSECSKGGIPSRPKDSLSTLHPEYVPPDQVKRISDSLRLQTNSERPVTQVDIKVRGNGGHTPGPTNIITVVNSYGEDMRQEHVPGVVRMAQSGLTDTQLATRPHGCPVQPVSTYVSLAQSVAGTSQNVACFVDRGTSCGHNTRAPAACFTCTPPPVRPVPPACGPLKQKPEAHVFQAGITCVTQTSSAERSDGVCTNQKPPTGCGDQPGVTQTIPIPTKRVGPPVAPRSKRQTPLSSDQPGIQFGKPGVPRRTDDVGRESPPPCRQRSPPCDVAAPGGPGTSPKRATQQTTGPHRSAPSPDVRGKDPTLTSRPAAHTGLTHTSPLEKGADDTDASTLGKEESKKPQPCTYTHNIIPQRPPRAHAERALPELIVPQASSSISLTLSSYTPIAGAPGTRTSPPQEGKGLAEIPQNTSSVFSREGAVFPGDPTPDTSPPDDTYVLPVGAVKKAPEDNSGVPGWNPDVTEDSIDQEMKEHVNEDGSFIVWRSLSNGQFVISVSYRRNTKHFQIHEKEVKGRVYFYIYPEGTRFTSLSTLVGYYQRYGIKEQQSRASVSPVGMEAQGSLTRGSHIRLRTPVSTCRKN